MVPVLHTLIFVGFFEQEKRGRERERNFNRFQTIICAKCLVGLVHGLLYAQMDKITLHVIIELLVRDARGVDI